jgi:hypothetical protein
MLQRRISTNQCNPAPNLKPLYWLDDVRQGVASVGEGLTGSDWQRQSDFIQQTNFQEETKAQLERE